MLLLGRLLGVRRRRRQTGLSIFLFIFGIMGAIGGCGMVFIGVPFSLYQATQVATLPQPSPAELQGTSAGTVMLLAAQLPQMTVEETHGLALFYVETRTTTATPTTGTPESSTTQWEKTQDAPLSETMQLSDGTNLDVQISSAATFYNAEQIESTGESDGTTQTERRTVGYLPGQTLTLEGSWEGNNRFIAQNLYAGTPDAYVNFRSVSQPISTLMMGLFCGVIGIILIVVAGGLRITGRG